MFAIVYCLLCVATYERYTQTLVHTTPHALLPYEYLFYKRAIYKQSSNQTSAWDCVSSSIDFTPYNMQALRVSLKALFWGRFVSMLLMNKLDMKENRRIWSFRLFFKIIYFVTMETNLKTST